MTNVEHAAIAGGQTYRFERMSLDNARQLATEVMKFVIFFTREERQMTGLGVFVQFKDKGWISFDCISFCLFSFIEQISMFFFGIGLP